MASTGRLVSFLGLLAMVMYVGAQEDQTEQCMLPQSWNRVWISRFEGDLIYLEYFNSSSRYEGLTNEMPSVGNDTFESVCEDSLTTELFNQEQFTVIAYKEFEVVPATRYCMIGIPRDDILLYWMSDDEERTNSYTVEECNRILESPTVFQTLIQYNVGNDGKLIFPDLINPVPPGKFRFSFKNGDDTVYCEDDETSVAEVNGASLLIKSCENTNTYKRPLNSELWIIGTVEDNDLNLALNLYSGVVVLAFPDDASPVGYYFYIGRYKVTMETNFLEIVFTTNDMENPLGYEDTDFIPPLVRDTDIMFFYIKSTECEIQPCQNGGTCVQLWLEYECTCADGFSGLNCTDDTDECLLAIEPCSGNGECQDLLGGFSCDCDPGWGGEFCDVQDRCNPNPCENGGNCSETCHTDYFCCSCPEPFFGQRCEFSDFCMNPDLCANGGTCYLLGDGDGFACQCTQEWFGKICEFPIDTMTTTTGPINPGSLCVEDADCLNDGACIESRCVCAAFWTGINCEVLDPWFIAAVTLIGLLFGVLLLILIICCCCCCGAAGGGGSGGTAGGASPYETMGNKSLDGMTSVGPAPGSVQFHVRPSQSATFTDVLTTT